MKLPSFQFYPGDWMKDPNLRAVSLAARGMWIDMLCLMHENDRRGYLQLASGKPVTAEHLARMTGCSTDDASRLLQELDDSGVFSRTEHGVLYSRRMVRDERKRQLCSEAGKKGGGNPTFIGVRKGTPKGRNKGDPKASSSPSTSSSEEETPLPPSLDTAEFRAVWETWQRHRREKRAKLTPTSTRQQFKQFEEWGVERSIAALNHSMRQGWTGLFEPDTKLRTTNQPVGDLRAMFDQEQQHA